MSWPIGYGESQTRHSSSQDGTIFANGVAVTETNGWVYLPAPPDSEKPLPEGFALRVRLSVDGAGEPYFYAEEAEVRGRRFSSVHALAKVEGWNWLQHIPRAFQREIARRLAIEIMGRSMGSGVRPVVRFESATSSTQPAIPAQRVRCA